MSIIAYAALTSKRLSVTPRSASTSEQQPGVRTYVDTLASLIPGEILALHAAILSLVAAPDWWVFAVLVGLCALAYIVGRVTAKEGGRLELADFARGAIPMAAFVVWTMLITPSAFGAGWLDPDLRRLLGVILAAVVILVASLLNSLLTSRKD
jgi:hypothetical protein